MTDATKTTKLDASEFLPDFESHKGVGITTEFAYYMGLTAACPIAQINCAGLSFPLRNDVFREDPTRPGKKMRVPVIGGMNRHVNVDHINALRETLKRYVVRFKVEPEQLEEPGTGKNTKAPHNRGRRGKLIKIPTAERVAEARAAGKAVPRYIRHPGDEPAARFMYMKLCPDQDNPERGHDFETIEESGIFWPGELDDATSESILT